MTFQLKTKTAKDLMTPAPITLRGFATVKEAVVLMTEMNISAVAIVDGENHPVGVLSQTDIIRYDREKTDYPFSVSAFYERVVLDSSDPMLGELHPENVDTIPVVDIMTPVVYAVQPQASVGDVVQKMLDKHVHRLFVVDEMGVLIGVISTFDILRQLQEV
ncbi:MAG: CBS domain-containing protein [Candidatus Sericytochromatia bacterium]|nr:CBS domain-containing protein [Candidatus Sericytochromatia bacterium]